MADAKIPETIPCQFDAGGWSPCEKPTDNGWCTKHEHLMCVSCGEKAVKSCDAQMGGLGCGAPLCKTCEHKQSGGGEHITKEVADQIRAVEKKEEEDKIASRTSPIRRMDKKFGVPANLFELLKGDWQKDGYKIEKIYFLEIKHGLMGFFPAIFSSDKKRMIFTTDLHLLECVWQLLDPEEPKIRQEFAYVNSELSIGYYNPRDPSSREEMEPFKVLTVAEFESLKDTEKPFRWAPGLIGAGISQERFLRQLAEQASLLD